MTKTETLTVKEIKEEAERKTCPLQKALYYTEGFLAGPMCGRCFPCSFGSYEARIRLMDIVEGRGSEEDIAAISRIAEDMLISSLCKKGKDTAGFILEWIDSGVFREHTDGKCRDMECKAFIEYRIIPEKCIMCGKCKDVCGDKAIFGKRKKKYEAGAVPYEIRQKRCTKCGECREECPVEAIIVVGIHEDAAVKV
ncbi:NADP-reducing hydrogenase subunit HndC [bacterium BMS3Abin07]|nr:NADP-reducing hydrogenase subunit HndC [bacterium BMS3Abin07]GBE32215.1 NADP-reducing hydrogenase subunit HndC [bacterium BMS3Bbin05]HDL20023.1 4Fe-4S dicluster domain-containing protein [Nitrospirota bacterium]HDO22872.1 4Fe-4S dicluster domain-containing protein [Nitrospirota bacterium]HDZ88161.1 4Fe-4S dicluster domain-containing protein [Nitrospirota bacterium]